MEINVQTAVVQIWLVLINASVILDSKRLKIKKDVSTLTSVIWKMYVRMDSVEIPRDHTNVTAIQEMSFIFQLTLNSQNGSKSEIFHGFMGKSRIG